MDFREALDYLKDGRKVRSCAWAPHDYVFLDGSKAYNGHGIDITFDFIDTQSEWELVPEAFATTNEDPNAPKWVKFSERLPDCLPFWIYRDGIVQIQCFYMRNYLMTVSDDANSAWMALEYPIPPRCKN